jgi:NAD(P)-dependent dehydrogenase (short-subunit alcohol dehydrogenase family)/alkylhydroperoxidase/carboxymuconolactone decarboxylase family protein YurZ
VTEVADTPVQFSGRCAVVTGAANGIGRGIAQRALEAGMSVVVADIDERGAAEVAGQLVEQGGKATAVGVDVTDPASVVAMADRVYDQFGEIALLCNNAGVVSATKPVTEITLSEWNRVLSVNLFGAINGAAVFLPRLVDQGTRCHVVNTASVSGFRPNPRLAPYTVSKYGVVALTETMRLDLADTDVGVSVLCPGPTDTALMSKSEPGNEEVERAHREFRDSLAEGMVLDPLVVGQAVFDGIRDGRFYILTHAHFRDVIATRFDEIVAAFDALQAAQSSTSVPSAAAGAVGGAVSSFQETYLRCAPDQAAATVAFSRRLAEVSSLDDETRELAYLAVLAALRFGSATPYHVRAARAAGASLQEVVDAVLVGLVPAGYGVRECLDVVVEAYGSTG